MEAKRLEAGSEATNLGTTFRDCTLQLTKKSAETATLHVSRALPQLLRPSHPLLGDERALNQPRTSRVCMRVLSLVFMISPIWSD